MIVGAFAAMAVLAGAVLTRSVTVAGGRATVLGRLPSPTLDRRAIRAGAPWRASVAPRSPRWLDRLTRKRAARRVEESLPAVLEGVARSLRSGASMRQAIEESAEGAAPPLSDDLDTAIREMRHGAGVVVALEHLASRRPLPGVVLAVSALCLGSDGGGPQARAIDGVATTLRERLTVVADVRALASQARMSALVIALAPVGFGFFAAATDPRTTRFLFHTPLGLALLTAGLLLDGLGWLWMQRICEIRP